MTARTPTRTVTAVAGVGVLRHERQVDVAVAAVTALLAVTTAWLQATRDGDPAPSSWAVVLLVAGGVVTVARRHHPVAVWLVTLAISVVYGIYDWPDPIVPISALVALAAVFEFADRRWRLPLLVASAIVGIVATAAAPDSDALDWWAVVFVLVAGPLWGAYAATRRALVAELRARAAALEAQRHREAEAARATERSQIARELHDIVAHHLTMLVIQAEAAGGKAMMSDDERRSSFDGLADSGRHVLGELRQVLAVLRSPAPPPREPQPRLEQVADLVDGVRAAGLPVTLAVHGDQARLPAAVELAGYRVVQEALTNVAKHAPGAATEVDVDVQATQLMVSVTNAPPATRPSPAPIGVGLVGLRERVELLGGTLDAGPSPAGGYRLVAVIPVDPR